MWRDAGSLLDMLKAARKVLEYASGLDEPNFMASSRDQDAILRQLTIVGEAAKRVSEEFRASHPEVPWRRVAGFRDVVVHDYFKVDLEEVWRIVQGDVRELIAVIEPLVPPENP
ncbi:MAG: DUF86 domain-containing protein [Acidobacteriota bacterium]